MRGGMMKRSAGLRAPRIDAIRVIAPPLVIATSGVGRRPAQGRPGPAGGVKAGMVGEPPSLDLHWTTAVIVQQIMGHVYETLYTYDRTLQPIPFLAEGHTAADGGRRYAIALRK